MLPLSNLSKAQAMYTCNSFDSVASNTMEVCLFVSTSKEGKISSNQLGLLEK